MKNEQPPKNIGEIKESLDKKEVSFAFIKPDFLGDIEEIKEILAGEGINVIYADEVRLSGPAVDYIYRDSQDEHFYDAMREHLISNDVVVLFVDGRGEDTYKVLSELKKKDGEDGIIRQRLQQDEQIDPDDISKWEKGIHPAQDSLSVLLTQRNVIHTADTADEAAESIKMILGKKFDVLRKRGNLPAELWRVFSDEADK